MSDQFSRFGQLPAEIRNMIWEYSLPEPRVYEVLDAPNAKQKTPPTKGLIFANVHPEPPPALAAVCRESRYFVLHNYKPLTLGQTTKYVDLSRDILLLEPYLLVKRLHRTLHFMSQIPLLRDSINCLALGTSYGVYTGICHPLLSWKVSKTNMAKLLSSLAKFQKLKLLVFIVHQEFQFEFDFRFPGTMTPIPKHSGGPGMPHITSSMVPLGLSSGNSGSGAMAAAASYPTPPFSPLSPSPSTTAAGARTTGGGGAGLHTPSPAPIASNLLSPGASTVTNSPPPPPAHRPQLVHQAYRFKFDIEANINHTPRGRPHLNELLYYPLDIDEDKEDNYDWDQLLNEEGENEWCDPWPTNDDWRRFRKRFQRAIHLSSLEMMRENSSKGRSKGEGGVESESVSGKGKAGNSGAGAAGCAQRDRGWGPKGGAGLSYGGFGGADDWEASPRQQQQQQQPRIRVPAVKGASLLWRYTRGGYV